MRSNLPAPALPGSGSDGRRRFSRPLSPGGLPFLHHRTRDARDLGLAAVSAQSRPTRPAPPEGTARCAASGSTGRASTSSAMPARSARTPSRCCARPSLAAWGWSSCATARARGTRSSAPAQTFRRLADTYGALFIVNDDPAPAPRSCTPTASTLARRTCPPPRRAQILGPEAIIGLSTHSGEQIEAAAEQPVDYISVGPIWETPTKEGRPATGLELVGEAAEIATCPGSRSAASTPSNVAEVVGAGARRICVVRAIRDAGDPARQQRGRWSTRWKRRSRGLMGSRERKRDERRKRKRRAAGRAPEPVSEPANGGGATGPANGGAHRCRELPGADGAALRGAKRGGRARAARSRSRRASARRGDGRAPIVSALLALVFTVSAVLAAAGVEVGGQRPRAVAARLLRRSPLADGLGDVEGPLLGGARLPDAARPVRCSRAPSGSSRSPPSSRRSPPPRSCSARGRSSTS